MAKKVTAPSLQKMKERGETIVFITCYDYPSARIAEEAGVDALLVGDSLGNVILGYPSTVYVELEDIVYHTKAVRRGTERALLVADLPFGSYHVSPAQAAESAVRLMKAGADAVKLEGAEPELVTRLVEIGIPVMGHLGFTPQHVNVFGGHKVQAREEDQAEKLINDAVALESAGAFAIVLELVPAAVSERVTQQLRIPTIGIGAGAECDGQIQVWHDVMGLNEREFKHAKPFANGREMFLNGLRQYCCDVRAAQFPTDEQSFE